MSFFTFVVVSFQLHLTLVPNQATCPQNANDMGSPTTESRRARLMDVRVVDAGFREGQDSIGPAHTKDCMNISRKGIPERR
jgi:hypothetical protein